LTTMAIGLAIRRVGANASSDGIDAEEFISALTYRRGVLHRRCDSK